MQLLGGLLTARIDKIGCKDQAGQARLDKLDGMAQNVRERKKDNEIPELIYTRNIM